MQAAKHIKHTQAQKELEKMKVTTAMRYNFFFFSDAISGWENGAGRAEGR